MPIVIPGKHIEVPKKRSLLVLETVKELLFSSHETQAAIIYNSTVSLEKTIESLKELQEKDELAQKRNELELKRIEIKLMREGIEVKLLSLEEEQLNHQYETLKKKMMKIFPRLSIVSIMRKRSAEQTTRAFWFFVSILIAHILYSIFSKSLIDVGIVILLVTLISVLFINTFVINYRIQKGFFGSNEREAREIISFVLQEAEKIDFTDDGKPKRLINKEDLEDVRAIANAPVVTSPAFSALDLYNNGI